MCKHLCFSLHVVFSLVGFTNSNDCISEGYTEAHTDAETRKREESFLPARSQKLLGVALMYVCSNPSIINWGMLVKTNTEFNFIQRNKTNKKESIA